MEAYQAVTEDGFTTVESVEEFGNMFMEDGHIKKGLDAVYIYDQPTKKWGVSEFSHAGEYGVCEFSFGKM